MSFSKDAPKPRLCHLIKWPDFNGYGFNLHSDKGKTGKYIGSVDEKSPAKAAGLEPGDILVEVNGENLYNDTHNIVVEKIKARPNETTLLVISPAGESYYSKRMIPIKSSMPNILVINVPLINPFTQPNSSSEHIEERSGEYNIRLCKLFMWPDFTGYGFNLQSIEGRVGQFIGVIDPNSPAELGCLKEGDRVIEVNQQDVTTLSHRDVVKLIMLSGKQVQLLVVDASSEQYFNDKNITISHNSPYLVTHTTPTEREVIPDSSKNHKQHERSDHDHNNINSSLVVHNESNHTNTEPVAMHIDTAHKPDGYDHVDSNSNHAFHDTTVEDNMAHLNVQAEQRNQIAEINKRHSEPVQEITGARSDPIQRGSVKVESGHLSEETSLGFAGSAKEARERMSKKKNVRDGNLSIKDKYEMLQKL